MNMSISLHFYTGDKDAKGVMYLHIIKTLGFKTKFSSLNVLKICPIFCTFSVVNNLFL